MTPGALRTPAAICLCISLLAFAAPVRAQAPSQTYEQTGTLPGGATYVVRREDAAATAAVELWFRAPGAGYDLQTPGISRLAIAAVAASSATGGTSLSDQVTRAGGTLSINVYPDIAMIGADVPAWDLQSVLRTMTGAYFSPAVTDTGFKSGLRDCAIAAAEAQYDSERVLQDALFAHLFAGGPARLPPVPASTQDYSKISLDSVKAFAARAFRESNAVLAVTGAVDNNWQTAVHSASLGEGGRGDAPIDSPITPHASDVTQQATVGGLGFAWAGPPITDEKASTALDFVADYLFDPDHGTVALAARKSKSDVFLSGQFITLHNPGVLLVTVGGSDAASMRAKVGAAITSLENPLDAKTFDAARKAFEYHIISQVQTPQSRADNFGWYASEGNLPYAPGDDSGQYLRQAQALDPGYVAQTVRQYLQHPAIVQLTSGHAEGTAS